jgi:hypothetical protein
MFIYKKTPPSASESGAFYHVTVALFSTAAFVFVVSWPL